MGEGEPQSKPHGAQAFPSVTPHRCFDLARATQVWELEAGAKTHLLPFCAHAVDPTARVRQDAEHVCVGRGNPFTPYLPLTSCRGLLGFISRNCHKNSDLLCPCLEAKSQMLRCWQRFALWKLWAVICPRLTVAAGHHSLAPSCLAPGVGASCLHLDYAFPSSEDTCHWA